MIRDCIVPKLLSTIEMVQILFVHTLLWFKLLYFCICNLYAEISINFLFPICSVVFFSEMFNQITYFWKVLFSSKIIFVLFCEIRSKISRVDSSSYILFPCRYSDFYHVHDWTFQEYFKLTKKKKINKVGPSKVRWMSR